MGKGLVLQLERTPELLIESVELARSSNLAPNQLELLELILENTNYEMIKDLLYKVD